MSITLTQAFLSEIRGSNMGSKQDAIQIDWEPYQEVIRTLYLAMDKFLQDVITYMKDTYEFHAR
jgi:Clr5 domain